MKMILLILRLIFWINLVARGEQIKLTKSPIYNMVDKRHVYDCNFRSSSYCSWTQNETRFDFNRYGYSYLSGNKCILAANESGVNQLKNISCIGYINYNKTIIDATSGQNVTLSCQLPTMETPSCVWKRNDVIVPIAGRYSNTYNLRNVKVCSIRIDNIEEADVGNWTCFDTYHEEIVSAFSLALHSESVYENSGNNSEIVERNNASTAATTEVPKSPSTKAYHRGESFHTPGPHLQSSSYSSFSPSSVSGLSVCIFILISITIGFLWKLKLKRQRATENRSRQAETHAAAADTSVEINPIYNQMEEDSSGHLIMTRPSNEHLEEADGYLIPKESGEISSDDVSHHIYEEIDEKNT